VRLLGNLGFAIAALAVTLQAWLAVHLDAFRGMYADFGVRQLPLVTRIALSPVWRYGAPIVVAALVGLAMAKRHTHPRMPIAVALIAIATLVGTYMAAQWPVFQLAGNIQP
jgi:hypothetical protein